MDRIKEKLLELFPDMITIQPEEMKRAWRSTPVECYTKNGEYVATYCTVSEAHRQTGIKASHIGNACDGARRSAGGYIWKRKLLTEEEIEAKRQTKLEKARVYSRRHYAANIEKMREYYRERGKKRREKKRLSDKPKTI